MSNKVILSTISLVLISTFIATSFSLNFTTKRKNNRSKVFELAKLNESTKLSDTNKVIGGPCSITYLKNKEFSREVDALKKGESAFGEDNKSISRGCFVVNGKKSTTKDLGAGAIRGEGLLIKGFRALVVNGIATNSPKEKGKLAVKVDALVVEKQGQEVITKFHNKLTKDIDATNEVHYLPRGFLKDECTDKECRSPDYYFRSGGFAPEFDEICRLGNGNSKDSCTLDLKNGRPSGFKGRWDWKESRQGEERFSAVNSNFNRIGNENYKNKLNIDRATERIGKGTEFLED